MKLSLLNVLVCLGLLTACSGQSEPNDQIPQVLDFTQTFYLNNKPIKVAVFDTQAEREKGLMWVKKLPENHGALFVFEKEGEVGFWMKNTLIPLDIYFFDSNHKLVKLIKDAQPCLNNCNVYNAAETLYVLEKSIE